MLKLTDVSKVYELGSAKVTALSGVSVEILTGDFLAITGPSGSGKSTLLNILGLLDRPTSGSMKLNGTEVSALNPDEAATTRNRYLGFVFQSFQLLSRLTACENVSLPLLYRGLSATERKRQGRAMLDKVGLGQRADHRPDELSGGQRQRVAIARALIGDPKILLADEPTGNLDSGTADEILDLFQALSRDMGLTCVLVTHDEGVAQRCSRRVRMLDGRISA